MTIYAAVRHDFGSGEKSISIVQTRPAKFPRTNAAETLVHGAAALFRENGAQALRDFDEFPAPLYATDDSGRLLYFNPACVEFAGRTPTLLSDRWCVSWKLYASDGAAMSHDKCLMAVAIHEGQPVREVEAFAERPDGERIRFRPFPTPAVNDAGRVVGAVNLLVPVDGKAHHDLLVRAEKCRSLAKWVTDKRAQDVLTGMASDCERHAAGLRID